MFVQTNSVKSIKSYFSDRLSHRFSENEIRLMGNEVISLRLGLSANDMIGVNDRLLSESDLLYFRSIVKRLLNDEPFQYIVGTAHFYGLELICDERALIPRPETEELVDWIKETYTPDFSGQILDVCTGSGCIALALKSIFPLAEIAASDFSKDALALAKENSTKEELKLNLFHFDATLEEDYSVLNNGLDVLYDCWVSNPPYIPMNEKTTMENNVVSFEPHMALFVEDDDPMLFYRSIAKMANKFLKKNGKLFFEIHEERSKEVSIVLEEADFVNIEIRKDLQGKNRMVKAEKM